MWKFVLMMNKLKFISGNFLINICIYIFIYAIYFSFKSNVVMCHWWDSDYVSIILFEAPHCNLQVGNNTFNLDHSAWSRVATLYYKNTHVYIYWFEIQRLAKFTCTLGNRIKSLVCSITVCTRHSFIRFNCSTSAFLGQELHGTRNKYY